MTEQLVKEHVEKMVTLPFEEWEHAKQFVFFRSLPKGSFFQRVGESPEEVGMVLSGILSASYVDGEGKERIKLFGAPGTLMGAYNSFLSKTTSSIAIRAETEVSMFGIRFSDLIKLYERHSCWQEFGRKSAEQHLLFFEKRQHELLMLSAKQRYEKFLKDYPLIVEKVPLWKIASYLGITPEALSRIRKSSTMQLA